MTRAPRDAKTDCDGSADAARTAGVECGFTLEGVIRDEPPFFNFEK
jgi:hypothetical protein